IPARDELPKTGDETTLAASSQSTPPDPPLSGRSVAQPLSPAETGTKPTLAASSRNTPPDPLPPYPAAAPWRATGTPPPAPADRSATPDTRQAAASSPIAGP